MTTITSRRNYILFGIVVGAALLAIASFLLSDSDVLPVLHMVLRRLSVLRHMAEENRLLAVVLYLLVYIALTTFSVPGAMWLSVFGGFLFGLGEGLTYAMIGATTGGTLAYLLGRYVFQHWIEKRTGQHLAGIKAGFKKNAFNYLLFLRLMPGCPFVVVNLAAATLPIKVPTFVAATFLGILPSTVAQVVVGSGIREIAIRHVQMSDFALNPLVTLSCVAAALVVAFPIAYRQFHKRRRPQAVCPKKAV
jgi:uncharacterized membrane protein YdjX (TVP38/TMEM64 family)